MVAYLPRKDVEADDRTEPASARTRPALRQSPRQRNALSRDMLHGLSPEEFDGEAKSLAAAESLTPQVRERMRMQLVERLKTPIDPPSWGPDWIKRGNATEPLTEKKKGGFRLASLFPFGRKDDDEEADVENAADDLDDDDQDDARVIAHNMEKSRQVWHFRGLYVLGAIVAISIALLAMFVDFQIIKGDIWTRALANEFMVVPASLQGTLLFKSLQVVFAVLIIHFMLKITGVYGRNALVTVAFLFALVMIGGLGYLVAYNNMTGGTSATLEHAQETAPQSNSIDQLFASSSHTSATEQGGGLMAASLTTPKSDEASPSIPKPSPSLLANADSWVWIAFASVIFFVVTAVSALFLQTFEHNVRNFTISRDYLCRRKQFAQLHLLELAEKNAS